MTETGTSLFVMLRNVLFDGEQQAAYLADPTGYLAAHGYDELDHDDVAEAMTLLADTLPPDQAALVSSAVSGTGTPAPTGDLAAVDQAAFAINHVVDTVRDGPDPTGVPPIGAADPGALHTGLDQVADPVVDTATSGEAGAAVPAAGDPGFGDPGSGDPAGGAVEDQGAPLVEVDDLSAFAAPDALPPGEAGSSLFEDPGFGLDPAGGLDDTGIDDTGPDHGGPEDGGTGDASSDEAGPDLGLGGADLTAPATFDLSDTDIGPAPADGSALGADLTDVDVTGAPVGTVDGERPSDLLDEDGF